VDTQGHCSAKDIASIILPSSNVIALLNTSPQSFSPHPQAWILFQFTMSTEVLDGILDIQSNYNQFLMDVQEATAGALPDISTSDVIIPEDYPAFQMYNDLLSNTSGLSLMGFILVVNMPWMINTSTLINGFTQVSTAGL
jgi:hypothetical protein